MEFLLTICDATVLTRPPCPAVPQKWLRGSTILLLAQRMVGQFHVLENLTCSTPSSRRSPPLSLPRPPTVTGATSFRGPDSTSATFERFPFFKRRGTSFLEVSRALWEVLGRPGRCRTRPKGGRTVLAAPVVPFVIHSYEPNGRPSSESGSIPMSLSLVRPSTR